MKWSLTLCVALLLCMALAVSIRARLASSSGTAQVVHSSPIQAAPYLARVAIVTQHRSSKVGPEGRASLTMLPPAQAELPLLGLIGLGSLVAGLIMRR